MFKGKKIIKDFCPLIKDSCIKEKCRFWHGFWNDTTKQLDYNCVMIWSVELEIELLQAITKL